MASKLRMDRRAALAGAAAVAGMAAARARASEADFLAEAFRMRDQAVAAGDQAYGAVMVLDGRIVGYGPSRVVTDANPDAHAERVALWAAQAALGDRLAGAVIYSTSRPCAICQVALAAAGVSRMVYGAGATDGGAPEGGV